MRVAVLSDIHGNLRALEAVHTHLRQASPDLIVNLGDCLSGPLWPEETAHYLMAEDWPTVRGNHDRMLAENPGADRVDTFVHQCLSDASLAWIAALPPALELATGLLLCHGTPASDEAFLLEEDGGDHFFPSNERQIREKLGDPPAELILCGHSHTPRLVRPADGKAILNPGSVGVQAFPGLTLTGSPHARYALATRRDGSWIFAQHAIEYDWTEAARRAEENNFGSWSHGLRTGFSAASVAS